MFLRAGMSEGGKPLPLAFQCLIFMVFLHTLFKNNYYNVSSVWSFCPPFVHVDKEEGFKMSTLVHWRGEGVKIGQNLVHVVVECPQLYFPGHNLLYLAFFLNTYTLWDLTNQKVCTIANYSLQCEQEGFEWDRVFLSRDKEDNGKGFFLSQGKGTMGQAQKVATGQEGTGFFEAVPFRPSTSHQILLV